MNIFKRHNYKQDDIVILESKEPHSNVIAMLGNDTRHSSDIYITAWLKDNEKAVVNTQYFAHKYWKISRPATVFEIKYFKLKLLEMQFVYDFNEHSFYAVPDITTSKIVDDFNRWSEANLHYKCGQIAAIIDFVNSRYGQPDNDEYYIIKKNTKTNDYESIKVCNEDQEKQELGELRLQSKIAAEAAISIIKNKNL